MKDAECSEMKEKSNFRFFELWLFLDSKYGQFLTNFHEYSKMRKIGNFFHLFHNVSQLFGSKLLFLRGGHGGQQIVN